MPVDELLTANPNPRLAPDAAARYPAHRSTPMPKSCVIYIRVSTVEQAAAGHHSLDAQVTLCRRYAEANGLTIVETIRDEGYSGRTTHRPGFRRLVEYGSEQAPKKINTILVQDTSRMGRDTIDYLMFRRKLARRGIDLIAVTQPNIDSSPEGRLMDTIIAGMNQYHSDEKSRRVFIAMLKKFEDGWWPTGAPLGYRNAERDGKRWIEPDPDRASLLRYAFTAYASGRHTQEGLRHILTEKGLRDRRGKPVFRTTFSQILANPFYYGLMRWAKHERMGHHEPLTDRRTWEQCQAVTAKHNKYVPRRRKYDFFLSGLTVCDACGRPHTHSVVRAKRRSYYHCNSRTKCPQPYIPREDLERQVADTIHDIQFPNAFIERVMNKVEDVFENSAAMHQRQLANVLRRKEVLEQQREVTEQKLVSGVLSDEAFDRIVTRIQRELTEVLRHQDELEGIRRLDTGTLRQLLTLARDIPAAYDKAPDVMKRQYVQFFFKEIRVRDRKIVSFVPTEFFEVIMEDKPVQATKVWCPQQDTIRTIIDLLRNGAWLSEHLKILEKLQPHAA